MRRAPREQLNATRESALAMLAGGEATGTQARLAVVPAWRPAAALRCRRLPACPPTAHQTPARILKPEPATRTGEFQSAMEGLQRQASPTAGRDGVLTQTEPPLPIGKIDDPAITQRWYNIGMTDTAESTIQLNNGHRVRVRPIQRGDENLLYDAFRRMSERSVYLRFLSPLKQLPQETAHHLADVDHRNRYALLAVEGAPGRERLLGVARYDRIAGTDTAEMAVAVPDDVQRQGIGAQLLSRIAEEARSQGIKRFMVLVLAENRSMLHLLRKMDWIHQARAKGGVYEITFDV